MANAGWRLVGALCVHKFARNNSLQQATTSQGVEKRDLYNYKIK